MTVKELKDILSHYSDDMKVCKAKITIEICPPLVEKDIIVAVKKKKKKGKKHGKRK